MNRFNIGDTVEVIANPMMNAKIGSRAIVKDNKGQYLSVTWVRPVLNEEGEESGQIDGGYDYNNFKRVETEWDS